MRAGTTQILWTGPEVSAATGGLTTTCFAASGVSIDSRTIRPGDLFVALKGPTFDGHDFVGAALAQGAAAAVVTRRPEGVAEDAPLVRVEDTMTALERLGRAARDRTAAKVAAITGSVGKTGTKEALGHVLARQGSVSVNAGSLNNHWGVPLSLSRLPRDAAFGVFEIGMNRPGEIAPLARMVRPRVAVVTTVKAVHSAHFSSTLEIAEAKAEIFQGLDPGGVAVINRDNRYFARLARHAGDSGAGTVLDFGKHRDAKVRLIRSALHPEYSEVVADVAGEAVDYRVGIPGRHWVMNSLAVLAAVSALGASVARAAVALADFSAPAGRGKTTRVRLAEGSFTLIDESYNASPVSVAAALDALGQRRPGPGGRRIAVLGDMLELGAESPDLHAALARPLRRNRVGLVFTAGKDMERLWADLPGAMRGGHAATSDRLSPIVQDAVRPGDVVMVKGSAGTRMGPIVEALAALGRPEAGSSRRTVNGEGA